MKYILILLLFLQPNLSTADIFDDISNKNTKAIKRKIAKGLDINNIFNQEGMLPVHFAASLGFSSIVYLLGNNGAQVSKLDKNGKTAAEVAFFNGHEDLAGGIAPEGINIIKAKHYLSRHKELYRGRVSGDLSSSSSSISKEKAILLEAIGHMRRGQSNKNQDSKILLYELLGKILNYNNVKLSCCMLCLKRNNVKIAGKCQASGEIDSFLKGYFNDDEEDKFQKLISLFCNGSKRQKTCNQHLTDNGVDQLTEQFFPFIVDIRSNFQQSNWRESELSYDSWLFYSLTSIFFNHLLIDLGANNSWTNRFADETVLHESWTVFFALRDFLLNSGSSPKFNIRLFIRSRGLHFPESVKESPVMFWTESYQMTDGSVHPVTVFALNGFYFLLTENRAIANDMLGGEEVFHHDIFYRNGQLQLSGDIDTLNLPAALTSIADRYNAMLVGSTSHDDNSFARKLGDGLVSLLENDDSSSSFASDQEYPENYTVQLPDGLRFNISSKLDSNWQSGALEMDDARYELLAFTNLSYPANTAAWLLRHKQQQYYFAVVHSQENDEQRNNIVAGYEFDVVKLEPNSIGRINNYSDFERLDLNLKPVRGSEHDFDLDDEKIAVEIPIAMVMLKYHEKSNNMKRPRLSRFSADIDGAQASFIEHNMIGDGDCGFHAIGISRQTALQQLLSHSSDIVVRSYIADMILERLRPSGNYPRYIAQRGNLDHARRFLQERLNTSAIDDDLVQRFYDALSSDSEIDNLMNEFASESSIFEAFIRNYLVSERGWLTQDIVNALAYINNIMVHILQRDQNDPARLVQMHVARLSSVVQPTNTFYLLNTGANTHFNLLERIEYDPNDIDDSFLEVVVSSNDSQEAVSTRTLQEDDSTLLGKNLFVPYTYTGVIASTLLNLVITNKKN